MTDLERLTQALKNRYQVKRELGVGGMATVYLARDLQNDRLVALKVLRPDIAATLGVERFLREITTAAKLSHPHIMPMLASGEADGFLYYAMPYMDGESLADRIDREGPLPLDEVKDIVREVADGLGYAHRQGVIHRDIKPENIMLSGGHAVIADFGIATAATSGDWTKLTQTGIAVGTALYMSPEQASGQADLDARSDIYSLGCVLYQSLAGQPPFTGDSPRAIMARHAVDPVPPLATVRSDVPGEVEAVVGKALDKVPADRFQSAEEFARTLSGEVAVNPKRARRWAALAAAALVVIGGAAAWWMNARGDAGEIASRDFRLAVMPFEIQSDDEGEAYLERGLMNLLGIYLDGAGQIQVVDQATVLGALGTTGSSGVTSERGFAAASQVGAGWFLTASLSSENGQFTLQALLYSATDSTQPILWSFGPKSDLDSLMVELATTVVEVMGAGREGRLADLGTSTKDWDAQKVYLRGVDYMYAGHYDSAVTALELAVTEDPFMADAWYVLSWAYEWVDPTDPRGYAALDSALTHVDHARERNRDLIRAYHAALFGKPELAERLANEVVAREPDWAEAWHILGTIRELNRWLGSGDPTPALEALEVSYRLHPGDMTTAWHYTWFLRNNRQWQVVDSIYRTAEAAGKRIFYTEVQQLFHALVLGTEQERVTALAFLDQLGEADPGAVAWVLTWLPSASDSVRLALAMAESLADNTNVPLTMRATGDLLAGLVNISLGNWTSAQVRFAEAVAFEPVVIVEPTRGLTIGVPVFDYALAATPPYLDVPSEDLDAIKTALQLWVPPSSEIHLRNLSVELIPYFREYLVGLMHARLGENDRALEVADQLERQRIPADSIALMADCALEIRALVAYQEGRLNEALAFLERQAFTQSTAQGTEPKFYRPFSRLLRAEVLADLGRYQEAIGWYQGIPYILGGLLVENSAHLSHIYGRMGHIYDEMGERNRAIDYYTRFVIRWRDADAKFQPRVDSARARLAELQAAPSGR